MASYETVHHWIPLVDYSVKTGISLSTLRRQIKAKKVPYKLENGRYLLLDQSRGKIVGDTANLQAALQRANEEIAELKTLIAFYEEQRAGSRQNA